MKLTIGLLCGALGLLTCGCTMVRVAPMVPEIVSALRRSHSFALDRIYSHIEQGEFDDAEIGLQTLENRLPPTPLLTSEFAYIRALIEERKGNTAAALDKYRAVMADHPDTPDAYLAAKKVRRLLASTVPVTAAH